MPKCSADQPYNNMEACIAVLYLNDWGIPLFSAFHIQKSRQNRIPQHGMRANRYQCEAFNRHRHRQNWNYIAQDKDGLPWTWDRKRWDATGHYNRGHLVPVCLATLVSLRMGAATFNMYNVAPQHKSTNLELSRSYESKIKAFADDYCLGEVILSEDVIKDFYFISGTLPDVNGRGNRQPGRWGDKENWIGPRGMKEYVSAHPGIEYSNIPGLFWSAACCLYTFPDGKKFAVTASYYIENFENQGRFTRTLAELKHWIYRHGIKFGSRVEVHNLLGFCEHEDSYRRIEEILKKYTRKPEDKADIMYKMNPSFPTSFPEKPLEPERKRSRKN